MKIRKSKFLQTPIIKKPLVAINNFLWWDVLAKCLSDKTYLSLNYWLHFHKKLNWEHPKTFNEKIQWLKINGREDIHRIMSDKYLVKKYISDTLGSEYVIPLIGVWDSETKLISMLCRNNSY